MSYEYYASPLLSGVGILDCCPFEQKGDKRRNDCSDGSGKVKIVTKLSGEEARYQTGQCGKNQMS
jgi:hypothetical protein